MAMLRGVLFSIFIQRGSAAESSNNFTTAGSFTVAARCNAVLPLYSPTSKLSTTSTNNATALYILLDAARCKGRQPFESTSL